ncbi:MAG: trypsin-like peptidase domain-containing protein [Actinomycetota bacterium]
MDGTGTYKPDEQPDDARSAEAPPVPAEDVPAETVPVETVPAEPAAAETVPGQALPPDALPPGAPGGEGRPPRRRGALVAAVLAGMLLLSGGVGIGWVLNRADTKSTATQAPITLAPQTDSSDDSADQKLDFEAITDKVTPAVVDITTVLGTPGSDPGTEPRARASGTGMLLTSSGQVLTNNHVIAGATSISIAVEGRSDAFTATVIGVNPSDDVALLQIQGVSGLPTVTLADSSNVRVGQRVVAIGNALGRGGEPTATSGSVTALGRTVTIRRSTGGVESLTNLIQFDAPISPGESGGPLVNEAGEVIGMITAAATSRPRDTVSEVGYSIPTNAALGIVNEIRAGRESDEILLGQRGFLGVGVRNMEPGDATRLGLNANSGALVVEVLSGTPAEDAGITTESVITAIDGQRIDSADDLGPAIHSHEPGDRISVTWVDGNGSHTATVTLIAGPAV